MAAAFLGAVLAAAFLGAVLAAAFETFLTASSDFTVVGFDISSSCWDLLSALAGTFWVVEFRENTFGPPSPSSFWTSPCFLADSWPSLTAWAK